MAEYDNPWTWRGEPFTDPTGWHGFVYLITNLVDGRRYVGRKYLWRRIAPLKGKKRRRTVQSDWRDYYGSSDTLKADVERLGKHSFSRQILSLHKTAGATNYTEVREQFVRDVLNDPTYYNETIGKWRGANLRESEYDV